MKLYTRNGDDGETGLFGGTRVSKDAVRVEAYGTIDELNSALGLAGSACEFDELSNIITTIQPRLFDLGADLCTPCTSPAAANIGRIGEKHHQELERLIDSVCEPLEPMKHFILPGGCELAARLHLARTICRRAERSIVTLAKYEPIGEAVIPYVNRLSDLLFAMTRRANQLAGVADVPWHPEAGV